MKFAAVSFVSLLWMVVLACGSWTANAQSSSSSSSSTSSTPQVSLQYNLLSAKIPNSISDHTGNLISNRFVYLAGGCNATLGNTYDAATDDFVCLSITDHFYMYDLVTDTFTTLPNMPIPRYRHVAAAVNNDQIWIFGGRNVPDTIIPQVDVFEIATHRWITLGDLPDDLLASDQGSFSYGKYAFVAGGYAQNYTAYNTVFRVDTVQSIATNSLKIDIMASLHQGRGDVAYTYDDTYAYVVGGFTNTNNFCTPLGDTERYSFAYNNWTWLAALNEPRSDLVVAEVNSSIFALGGERQLPNICNLTGTPPAPGQRTLAVDAVEYYNEAQNQWAVIADLPEHRFRFAAVVYNNTIYTFGGQSAFNASCNCYRTSSEVVAYLDVTGAAAAATTTTTGGTSAASKQWNEVSVTMLAAMAMGVGATMMMMM